MARLAFRRSEHSQSIVVIDDDEYLARSFQALLTREGHDVVVATEPRAGVEVIRSRHPQLVLLDYMMPGMTGADVVRAVRQFDTHVQIILVTGYAEEQPGRKLIAELDIQGYHDKGNGAERLLVLVDAALKYARLFDHLERQSERLHRLVQAAPIISKLRPAHELYAIAIAQLVQLLDDANGLPAATTASGLFVMQAGEEGARVCAGTGRFEGAERLSDLSAEVNAVVADALVMDQPASHPFGMISVPVVMHDGDRGCMVVESATTTSESCPELCTIYAGMVTQALENVVLFDLATHDPLCRTWNRSAGLRRLTDVLRLDSRSGVSTAVLLADIDHFKRVNDNFGHAAGDVALHAVAQAMVQASRSTDLVCRYGGEEFLVVLPATDAVAAMGVAEKLRKTIEALVVTYDGTTLALTVSFGVAVGPPMTFTPGSVEALVRRADGAMYAAKAAGRNRVTLADPLDGPAS